MRALQADAMHAPHEADLEREEAEARQPPRFWGVFSEEPGASGVYTVEAPRLSDWSSQTPQQSMDR